MFGASTILKKIAITYGFFLVTGYLIFRLSFINFTLHLGIFSVVLFIAELHTLILMYGMLYSLWPRKFPQYNAKYTNKKAQINLFITVAGEPTQIVKNTISHAVKAVEYYKKNNIPLKNPRVIVLNDGKAAKKANWEKIEDYCKKNNIIHIARSSNSGYKAGNINNGIQTFSTDDKNNTIDCFLDADFSAKKNFLTDILKPFSDPSIDFVRFWWCRQ